MIPLVTYPYLINTLGKNLYGVIIYSQAIVSYLAIFVNWGFNISATKYISINREDSKKINEIVSVVYIVKTLLLIIVFGFLFLIFLFPEIREYKLLYIFSMWQCIYECLFPIWFFQGIEKMKYIAIFSFIGRVVFILLIFIWVTTPQDYLLVPLINGIGAIITSLIAIYILIYKFKIKFRWQSLATIFYHTKDSTKLLLTSITGIVKDRTTVIGVLLYFIVGCSLKSFILLFFNNDMLMAIPVYWMLGTLFIYRHLSYFLGTVILISHNHVKDVIVNMFYSMFVYLFVIMFLGIIDCLNIYTLSISLVISVFFETLQRWYYCKKYGII